jgi:hypothetical protein
MEVQEVEEERKYEKAWLEKSQLKIAPVLEMEMDVHT